MKRLSVDEHGYLPDPNGPYVLYDDAQRAIAAAEQRVVDQMNASHPDEFMWDYAQRDMLARCLAAVEKLRGQVAEPWGEFVYREVLPALRALSPDGGE
jgi:hypothetical protein